MTATLLLAALMAVSSSEAAYTAKVVGVADGDTITVLRGTTQIRVRLDGIDCPEGGQDFSNRAKQFTSSLVFGREVLIEPRDIDRYGRTVARVFVDEKDVSVELVTAGFAWHFTRYSSDPVLAKAEVDARSAKRGLWADPYVIAPWEFRSPSNAVRALRGTVGPYHGNVRSRVFHAPGCQHYTCPNCRQIFASISEAEAAGYRRHVACVR
jgi:micrococcal nuclease